MDNVTHTLFALTLARTRLGRGVRGATAALVLASNAPDADVVATFAGARTYLQWHRGPTHGPFGIVGLALLTAVIVWVFFRARGPGAESGSDATGRQPPFIRLAAISLVGVLLHVLMDLPTSYGVRLLSPLDWHWFTTDWMPIVDIYLIVALAAGLYFGGRSESRQRFNATIVLIFMAVNYGVRAGAHERAIALAPRLFGPTLPGRCEGSVSHPFVVARWPQDTSPTLPPPGEVRCLVEVAAIPGFLSPFDWRVIMRTSNEYALQDVNVLSSRLLRPPQEPEALWRLASRYPNQWTPSASAAAATRTAQVFLGFSRLPAVRSYRPPPRSTNRADDGTMVQFTDVRFFVDVPRQLRLTAGRPRGGPPAGSPGPPAPSVFTVTVQLDRAGRVVDEHLGP